MIPLSSLKDHIPTTSSSLFSTYASFAGSIMLVRSVANELLPYQFRTYIYSNLRRLFSPLSSRDLTFIIEQTTGGTPDQLFEAASLYLGTKISSSTTDRLRLGKTPRQKNISFSIDKGQEIFDTFDNFKLKWRYLCTEPQSENKFKFDEKRYFQLTFPKKHKDKVVDSYLPHVFAQANAIKEEQKVIKIYSRSSGLKYSHVTHSNPDGWGGSINLEHPATFDTMAMDPELKNMIVEDLERFLRRREFYKKVGKAWKRGYLLYGPPGTGKSSLIAAMANYLKFDVYDLELSSVSSDVLLKRILLSTTNRSILVIEDIDCSIDIEDREYEEQTQKLYPRTKFTLSGLLNFIDGLWSSCGDERIIVFTTNHKDRLDPALLRPGRMDVHIHMSYLTPSGFKVLASNYLDIHDNNPHRLCEEIEGLIKSTEVTPAEVAEELMKSDDADVALGGLVNFLKRKRVENEEREKEEESNETHEVQEAKRKKTDDNYNKIVTNGRLARRSIFKSTIRRPMDLPMLF